jgi:hypothetical protein
LIVPLTVIAFEGYAGEVLGISKIARTKHVDRAVILQLKDARLGPRKEP